MAITFHALPLEAFDDKARPYIKRLNAELRDLFGLEGTLRQPLTARRSDLSVTRRGEVQVDSSRITPSITQIITETVTGSTTIIGTPGLTLGTSNIVGNTTTVLSINSAIALFGLGLPAELAASSAVGTSAFAARTDHVHLFPASLRSTTNASLLTLTDDGVNQTLTGSLGSFTISPRDGNGLRFDAGTATSGLVTASVQFRPFSGGIVAALQTQYTAAALTSASTVHAWNVSLAHAAGMTASTFIGYDMGTFSFTPGTGSDTTNSAYGAKLTGPLILNNTGGWTEVAALYLSAPRRLATNPTVTVAATEIVECPTVSGTTQIGLLIKQRTAQQTAANRYGILIEAHNSGTLQTGIQIAAATGAAAGSHLRLLDKAGDVSAPVAGDIWVNARALKFYEGTLTHNLTPQTTKGDIVVHDGTIEQRLVVGADTRVLTADSTQATGVTWAVATGTPGAVGPIGPSGLNGEDGMDGDIGPVGPVGAAGSAGSPGAQGPMGPAIFLEAESIEGEMGPPGAQGSQGATGPQGAPGSLTLTDITQDLGVARSSGTFDIFVLSATPGKNVTIMQTAQAIASKGNARDEPEMDQIQATGYVADANTLRIYWQAPSVVVGTYAFGYAVSG